MKKLLLPLFLLSSLVNFSQNPHFLNLVKNNNGNLYSSSDVLRLSNGNKVTGAYLTAGMAVLNEGGFVTFNNSGAVAWHKTVQDYYPQSMVENGTSFYCVMSNFHSSPIVSKNNSNNGNFTWIKSFSLSNPFFTNGLYSQKIFKEGTNNAFFFNTHDNNNTEYTLLAKVDANGNSVSCKRFDSIYPSSVAQISNDYLLLGKRTWQSTDSIYYLIRMDANMNTIWSQQINYPNNTNLTIAGIENNSIFLSGTNAAGDGVITKFDLTGNLMWSKAYYSSNINIQGIAPLNIVYKANKLYMLGYIYDFSWTTSNSLTTLDINGSFIKNRILGYNTGFSYTDIVVNPSDTSIFSVGSIDDNPGNNYGMYASQFSLDGDLEACEADSIAILDSIFSPIITTAPLFTATSETLVLSNLTTTSLIEVPYVQSVRTRIDSIVPTLPSCANPCAGEEIVYYSGIDQNPQLDWSLNANGQTGSYINALCAGTYSVTLTDAFGCVDTASTVLNYLPPPNPEICLVTVDSMSTHNVIYWDKTTLSGIGIDSFRLYREDITNVFSYIGSVAYDSLSEYHDYGANPNVTTKRYRISVKDTCGVESLPSPYHNTVYITYSGFGQFNWNPLYTIEGQANPVIQYLLMRDDNSTGVWNQIAATAGTQFTINDPAYASFPNAQYRVEADWSINCIPTRGAINTTRSNIKSPSSFIGIQEVINQLSFSISPNPANTSINITSNTIGKETLVEIYTTLGQKVMSKTSLSNTTLIDISNLDSGAYFIKLTCDKTSVTKKLIKE